MKSTESIDDAGKSTGLSPATEETVTPDDTSMIENKRRRLVRGAVAFAPLVLTLRSGALAAASCTGLKATAKTRSADTDRPGRIVNATPVEPVEGDVCVRSNQLTTCDTNPNKVLTSSNLTQVNTEPVALYTNPALPLGNNNPYLVCGTSTSGPNQNFIGRNISILSAQSVTSMVIGN